jgi:hypothetical protein
MCVIIEREMSEKVIEEKGVPHPIPPLKCMQSTRIPEREEKQEEY